MKYPTVSALCEGVAGAIRAKEGSTEKINPQDFVQRIENLQVGGGTSEDKWRYFDCKQTPIESREDILVEIQAMLVKVESHSLSSIMSAAMMKYPDGSSEIVAFGVDMSIEVNLTGEFVSLGQLYETLTDMLAQAGIIEITKEQFYTLE
jgi:hypothetical protein